MPRVNLDTLHRRRPYDRRVAERSENWFKEQIKYLKDNTSPNALMNSNRKTSTLVPGNMYLYYYHPKYMAELPYYDIFPLVVPFSRDTETFTGLNFHYLPTKMRAVLLKNLLQFATDKRTKETTKLELQWSYISGVSQFPGVKAAVKKYRYDHVQSQFLHIPATQWFNAIMLPVEKFHTGANMSRYNKESVWTDSIRM